MQRYSGAMPMLKQRSKIEGPSAWTGAEMMDSQDWTWSLSGGAVAEIEAALAAARRQGLAWHEISRATFPLGGFAEDLRVLADELEDGRGIVLLRGLPVERFTADELKTIHFGLGCHLGTVVYQSAGGELLGEITDEGAAALERGTLDGEGEQDVFLSSRARVQTTGPLRFHTDRTDVVALLCARQAVSGGDSRIVSAVAIHNAMLERRPDLLELLFEPYPRSRLGEERDGAEAYYMLPVFASAKGKFTTHYSRTYVEAGQKLPHVPRLSEAQWEALDLLQALGDELALHHRFEAGDIQYLNNHVLFHARSAYKDGPGDAGRRLLYRLWLSMPNSRALPAGHKVLFGATAAGALRGGIAQPGGHRHPLTAAPSIQVSGD